MTSDLPHLKVRSSKMSVRSGAVTCCDFMIFMKVRNNVTRHNEAGGKTALPGVYVNYPFLMRFSNISRGGFFYRLNRRQHLPLQLLHLILAGLASLFEGTRWVPLNLPFSRFGDYMRLRLRQKHAKAIARNCFKKWPYIVTI